MKRLHRYGYRLMFRLYFITPDIKPRINNAAMWFWDRSDIPDRCYERRI
jgi:hypothetical protein